MSSNPLSENQLDLPLSKMLAALRYELMTPITSIVGFSELLLDSRQNLEDRLNNIRTIIRNSHYLLSVMDAIIQLAQHEAPLQTVPAEETSLIHLVDAIRKKVNTQVDTDQLVHMQYALPMHRILRLQSRMLRDTVLNMVLVALRLREKGSIAIDFASTENNSLKLSVNYQGPAPTQKQVEKAIEMFNRDDGQINMRYRAIALELSFVNCLIKVMGGSFTIEAVDNEQSKLVLLLPDCFDVDSEMINDAADFEQQIGQVSTGQLGRLSGRVLLADDNPDNLALLSAYLKQMGLEVDAVGSGAELLHQFEQQKYDLLVTDVEMPGISGLDAVRNIRAKKDNISVIAITANSLEANRATCLAAGCDAFISKPVAMRELEAVVSSYVNCVDEKSASMEPLYSVILQTEPDMKDIVFKFVARLPATLQSIDQASSDNDWEVVRTHIHQLKGLGTAMGYPVVTELCAKLEFQIMGNIIQESRMLLGELISVGARICAGLAGNDEFTAWKSRNDF